MENENDNTKEPLTAKALIDSDDLNFILLTHVELTEDIATTYKEMREAQTESEKSDLQGELSILYALQQICTVKIKELQDKDGRLNHNFRVAAKYMLKKETYNSLMAEAAGTVRDMKAKKVELKKNKLE